MARIVLTEGDYKGREVELSINEVIIGRDEECNLPLNDSKVSRRHAKLYFENGVWNLADLDSANGTALNHQPVTISVLRENDVVSIGATTFIFKKDSAPEVAVAAPAAPAPTAKPEVKPESKAAPVPPVVPAATAKPEVKPEPKAAPEAGKSAAPGMMASAEDLKLVEQMRQSMDAIRKEVGKVIIGQEDVLNEILMCIIAGGHALLIGLPGLAKTLTVNTIAKVLDMKFKRVQFTPDLMPSDITGTEVLETDRVTQQKEFRFMQGPIFCNLLLADEINRTPPKTQAALLEAMQEKQVSVGKEVYKLDKPFFVLATQNPIEQEGTYPLPEAQLDRFMFNIFVDYPKRDEEITVIARTTGSAGAEPQVVIDKKAVIHLQEVVRKIPVSEHVIGYAVSLVRATRPGDSEAPEFTKKYVSTGAGPRAGQYLVLAAKARAVLEGRIHVSCNDIRGAAMPVLRHRILTNFAADSEGLKSVDIVKRLLAEIKEPGAETYEPPKPAAKKK
jgi:MoxR-like ATPase